MTFGRFRRRLNTPTMRLDGERRPVVLKLSPTTDPLLGVLRAFFRPMIDRNLVQIVTGGGDVGSALANHTGIAAVHMTGPPPPPADC